MATNLVAMIKTTRPEFSFLIVQLESSLVVQFRKLIYGDLTYTRYNRGSIVTLIKNLRAYKDDLSFEESALSALDKALAGNTSGVVLDKDSGFPY